MSKAYRDVFKLELEPSVHPDLAAFTARGGAELDGLPLYTTEQSHLKECDVNNIIAKYDKTGLIDHISQFEGEFGDVSGIDFRSALDLVTHASESFMSLPASVRARFDNTPELLLKFMEDAGNRDEAIALGLIVKESDPSKDGLGEHVKDAKVVVK